MGTGPFALMNTSERFPGAKRRKKAQFEKVRQDRLNTASGVGPPWPERPPDGKTRELKLQRIIAAEPPAEGSTSLRGD